MHADLRNSYTLLYKYSFLKGLGCVGVFSTYFFFDSKREIKKKNLWQLEK